MHHKSLYRLGLLMLLAGLASNACTLEEVKEYEDSCPGLQYIQTDYGRLICSGEPDPTCKLEGVDSECTDEECHALMNGKYKEAFLYEICPSGYKCNSNHDEGFCYPDKLQECADNQYYSSTTNQCEPSTVNFCGSETNDCTAILGWSDGTCENNQCIVSSCTTGFALKDNACVSSCGANEYYSSTTNQCEPSTVNFCGSETNDCTQILGWSDGTCENNKCIVSSCTTGFALKDNACVSSCGANEYYSSTTNQCEPSTVNFCGLETNDCTQILGWSDGTCENNKCIVSSCTTGFALKDNACVSSCGANEYYSSTSNKCEASTVNFCGSETNDCTQILGWSDGTCENNKCIVSSCTTGFALKDNACVSSCGANEYYSSTTNQCEASTVNFCGSETNDCTAVLGWSDGTCENNKCVVSSCTTGFALKDNACVSSCGANEYYSSTTNQCEASTVNFCGSETNDCTQILGWSDGTCENNKCIVSSCTTGFALKDNACVSSCGANEYYSSTSNKCEASSVNRCGSETNDCTQILGWSDGTCENNKCIVSVCTTGFALKANACVSSCGANEYYSSSTNKCESSSVEKCGSETNNCKNILGWDNGSCTNNKCIVSKCTTGYKVKDNACVSSCGANEYYSSSTSKCEPSSEHKCGSETNNCTKVAGWETGTCVNNVCTAQTCEDGYQLKNGACHAITSCGANEYYYNKACQKSSVNKCGSETNDCTKAAGWANGKCVNNVCIAEDCETGYKLVNNACQAITSCATNEYYYNGSCVTSTVNKCGSETNDCTKAAGWAGGSCESNVCKATKCETGYNWVNGACKAITSCATNQYYYNGSCVTSTVNKCGSETNDCTKAAGWADGSCTSNICKATKCETGYNLVNGACKAITSCATNEYYYNGSCVTSTVNKCGSETNDCTKAAGWAGGSCTSNICEAIKCENGYNLVNGSCKAITSCATNEYYYNGNCVTSTVNKCGSETNDCTKAAGWADGSCTSNVCEAIDCEQGYKLIGGSCKAITSCATNEYYYNGSCVTSTVNKCGSETNDCTKAAGWAGGSCESNVCKATACETGYNLVNGACKAITSCATNEYYYNGSCVTSSVNKCGSETNDCTLVTGWTDGSCESNVCKATKCETGYNLVNGACKAITSCATNEYYYNGSCVTSTVNKCGSETNDCTKAAGWAGGSCESNVCKAIACETGYNLVNGACKAITSCATNEYYYNGSCVTSTVNKCGSETNDCTKAAGWAGGSCASNVCKATACETGYNLVNGACKAITSCATNEYYYNGNCVTSTVNKCGSETNDCTKAAGWADGSCTSNVCEATKCETGYNVVTGACKAITSCATNEYYYNGSCVTSTVNKCGSETNDCTKAAGWADGSCTSNVCKATKCETGYNVVSGSCKAITSCATNEYYYNGNCVTSTVNKCGSETNDCTKAAGWADGSCTSNVCKAAKCETGYNLVNGSCKAITSCDTNQYYYNGSCVTSTVNKCGSETNDCTKAAGWAEGSCTSNVCKATKCETGYELASNACKAITSCATNQYYYNGSCVTSTVNKCGSETNDCTKAAGWADGSCTSNVCKATKCETGYNLVNGSCKAITSCATNQYYYNGSCVTSTVNKCGSETNDCTKAAGWADGSCTSNVCKATKCETGYNLVNGSCKAITSCDTNEFYYNGSCQKSSIYKCGSVTNDCTKAAGWVDGSCTSNICEAIKCENGYKLVNNACRAITSCATNQYYYNGSCVTSTVNKCGSETNDCTKAAGWAGGSCESNVCKATACETGYNLVNGSCKAITSCATNEYYYNGSCVTSTVNKCGSETNDCAKAAGWAGGSCESNVCKATACETGYNLVNGACKAITSCGVNQYYYNGSCHTSSVKNCGSETNNCTKAAGWADGSCVNNICQAKSCTTGYVVQSGVCVADTTGCPAGQTKVSCLGDCYHDYIIKEYLHMDPDCNCLDDFMNEDGHWENGCETCDYKNGFKNIDGVCKKVCDGSFGGNYYCAVKNACCPEPQWCEESGQGECEYLKY